MNMSGFIISFLLGLFSSLIVDELRAYIRNKKNKKFIKFYLKDSILLNLPKLKSDFNKVLDNIKTYGSSGSEIVSLYEDFNTNVFRGLTSVEQYQAFKQRFVLLNEIVSIVEFLSQNLPIQIHHEFYDFLNLHLKEKDKIGDVEHVKTCGTCIQKQKSTISFIENRVKEVDILKSKIEELLK